MIKKLLLYLLTLCHACSFIAGPSHGNDSHKAYNKHFAVKHISKRDVVSCQPSTQYLYLTTTCCNSCDPGFVVVHLGCTADNPKTICKPCTEGEEYMDKPNHKSKCLRCSECDRQQGLEVETNCTSKQNIQCRCMPGHFCDSKPCQHCEQCDRCEDGKVLEECTETQNTKCRTTGSREMRYLALPFSFIMLVLVAVFMWKKISVRNKKNKHKTATEEDPGTEMNLLKYPDVDLTPYIADIAEEMKLEEVKKLVRKLSVSPIRLDEVMLDYNGNASELKIRLLELWYQEKGRTDAYRTLITTLRALRFCSTADRIEQKLRHEQQSHD